MAWQDMATMLLKQRPLSNDAIADAHECEKLLDANVNLG